MPDNPLANIVPDLNLDVTVNTDDVINIAVSEHEDELERRIKGLDSKIKRHDISIKDNEQDIKSKLMKYGEYHFDVKIRNLVSALQALGKEVKKELTYHWESRDISDATVEFTMTVSMPYGYNNSNRLYFKHTVSLTEDHGPEVEMTLLDDIYNLLEGVESLKEIRNELMRKSIDLGRELKNIDKMVRKTKSEMSRMLLSKSEAGRDILNNLQGSKRILSDNSRD